MSTQPKIKFPERERSLVTAATDRRAKQPRRRYLVTMLKWLGCSVRACWRPGPVATTLLGSQPSATATRNGL